MKLGHAIHGAVEKIFRTGWAPEGQTRPAAGFSEFGNMFSIPFGNGWERGLTGTATGSNGIVYALVQCYVMALGASGMDYRRQTGKGGWETVTNDWVARLLRNPNQAQTSVEFITVMVSSLFYNGNFYAAAQRNNRNEIIALWPLSSDKARAAISLEDGSVYYDVSSDYKFIQGSDLSALAPAREVLHIKLPSHDSILTGESPVSHAAMTAALNSVLTGNATTFNANSSQGSGILSTDQVLTGTQMQELRAKFDELTTGVNRGKVPILGGGMKFSAMSISAQDAQFIETYNMTVLDLCRIFRVPPQLLGLESNGAASSVEVLINQWRASGLLYFAELIEACFERLFGLDAKEEIRFDLANISRADSATEMSVLTMGVQNSVFTPNEARNKVGLDSVEYGDDCRTQAQNVRLQDAKPAVSSASAGQDPPAEPEDTEAAVAESKAFLKRVMEESL